MKPPRETAVPPSASASEEDRARGLNPPTDAERAEMDRLAPPTGPVEPNTLGLERINAERAARGLPPLTTLPDESPPAPAAPDRPIALDPPPPLPPSSP